MGRRGKVVFTHTDKRWRVKCDFVSRNPKVALALFRIVRAFEVSVERTDKKVGALATRKQASPQGTPGSTNSAFGRGGESECATSTK